MAIKDLKKILEQVHEPDEYRLVPHDLTHPLYWIWKIENAKMKDLNSFLSHIVRNMLVLIYLLMVSIFSKKIILRNKWKRFSHKI
jgi:hypothetical protein